MFSFASFLDLPLIWYGLIMTAMFLYVILDGFDLGVGILFPLSFGSRLPDNQERFGMLPFILVRWVPPSCRA
jgi:cytochrome bd-type quinol oxidase subunit 2